MTVKRETVLEIRERLARERQQREREEGPYRSGRSLTGMLWNEGAWVFLLIAIGVVLYYVFVAPAG